MSARPAFQQEQPGVGWTQAKRHSGQHKAARKRKFAPTAPRLPATAPGTRLGRPAQVHPTRPGPGRPADTAQGAPRTAMPH